MFREIEESLTRDEAAREFARTAVDSQAELAEFLLLQNYNHVLGVENNGLDKQWPREVV